MLLISQGTSGSNSRQIWDYNSGTNEKDTLSALFQWNNYTIIAINLC